MVVTLLPRRKRNSILQLSLVPLEDLAVAPKNRFQSQKLLSILNMSLCARSVRKSKQKHAINRRQFPAVEILVLIDRKSQQLPNFCQRQSRTLVLLQERLPLQRNRRNTALSPKHYSSCMNDHRCNVTEDHAGLKHLRKHSWRLSLVHALEQRQSLYPLQL